MAKSFFENRISQQQSSDFSTVFTPLYLLPDRVQYCHHNTTSYEAHKALDTTYETIDELKDDIIEQLVGYTGQRPTIVNLQPITGYTEEMNSQVANEIMAYGQRLQDFAERNNYPNIENLAQEYSGAGAKLKYLLTLK